MSRWREQYKVHPAADVFPMMSDDELAKLGEDIKANGIRTPVKFYVDDRRKSKVLIDGRNRLEAAERIGVGLREWEAVCVGCSPFNAVPWIISLNINRRHLTKQQQADLIVAAHKAAAEAPRQVGEMPKRHVTGKAGSEKDAVKAAAVATAQEHGISKRTVERSLAKAEGKTPSPTKAKPKPEITVTIPVGICAARRHYTLEFAELTDAERVKEWGHLHDAIEKAFAP